MRMLFFQLKKFFFFFLLIVMTYGCAQPRISDVRIERFEKMDEQPIRECYLVYGYHKSIELEAGSLIDQYVCDSIFPNITIDSTNSLHAKYLYFFKRTKNTNNEETYRSKIKRAIADRDVIFIYIFDGEKDSSVVPYRKIYRFNEWDEISEPFRCN